MAQTDGETLHSLKSVDKIRDAPISLPSYLREVSWRLIKHVLRLR